MFNLGTNNFKPNRLKNVHYCQILKGNVTILQHKSLHVCLLLIFPCQSNISGFRLWLMALMLDNGTLQNFLQSIHVYDNFTFIYNYYTRQNDYVPITLFSLCFTLKYVQFSK